MSTQISAQKVEEKKYAKKCRKFLKLIDESNLSMQNIESRSNSVQGNVF